ncbi:MAG: tRNA pseudouridine synthase A [Parachlamydia sp.]|nr:tRNA pseudouridine synthase A [Parachlamydia sp.]
MPNLKLTVAYDGGNYLGWQKTQEGPSIEESLQRVLEQILQQPLPLQAASRTDAGVHAFGQVVNCLPESLRSTPERLRISLNSLLPEDIRILDVELAHDSFHPTLDCKEKEYHYWICNSAVQLPQHRFYSWHVHTPLDLIAMDRAAEQLAGTHDFAAFCNAIQETEYENTIRTVHAIELIRHPLVHVHHPHPFLGERDGCNAQIHEEAIAEALLPTREAGQCVRRSLPEKGRGGEHVPLQRLQIIVKGSNFLYRMVRNLAGTLVDIGRGKLALDTLEPLLTHGKRAEAGITAPAHGLTLFRVYY